MDTDWAESSHDPCESGRASDTATGDGHVAHKPHTSPAPPLHSKVPGSSASRCCCSCRNCSCRCCRPSCSETGEAARVEPRSAHSGAGLEARENTAAAGGDNTLDASSQLPARGLARLAAAVTARAPPPELPPPTRMAPPSASTAAWNAAPPGMASAPTSNASSRQAAPPRLSSPPPDPRCSLLSSEAQWAGEACSCSAASCNQFGHEGRRARRNAR